MNHRAVAGFREKPLAAETLRKINGLGWTEMNANAAAFARGRIDPECSSDFLDGIEPAERLAESALQAICYTDDSFVSAVKRMILLRLEPENQMQVGCIDIAVDQHRIFRERSERGRDTGFACSAFAADDDEFFH
jgi:hypothetical protein